jgi:phytoene dehydrogenase-like protein
MSASADNSEWDAIVIGSGLGGLTSAAYLATAGMRTLVLEQWDVAGGCSHVFRRRRKFEFDVGLHYIGDCAPGGTIPKLLGGLGLEGRIEFLEMDPDGFDTLLFPGLEFRVPRGWGRYRERLIDAFPAEAAGLNRCVDVLERVAREIETAGMPMSDADLGSFVARAPTVIEWGVRPLGELFDACGLSTGARGVLAGESADHGAPPSRVGTALHASLMHHYLKAGAYYPRGGGQVFAGHLIDVIAAHGGRVRTRARVEEIMLEAGSAVGVRLRGGETITAPVIVSNADIKRTFLELLDRDQLAPATVERTEAYRMALPLFSVYLGVDVDLREHMPNTNYWVHGQLDPETAYDSLYAGEMPDSLSLFISSGSVKDPHTAHIAPPGHSSLEVMMMVPPGYEFWAIERGPAAGERYSRQDGYRAVKDGLAEAAVRRACEILPAIDGHIVWQEASTPITQERYTLSSGGSCYGLEHSADQSGPLRPRPGTEIDGLFLTGASTMSGHGIVGVMRGAVHTAGAVLGRDLWPELDAGRVFGDPSLLRAGGADWDPLKASRGLSEKPLRRTRVSA